MEVKSFLKGKKIIVAQKKGYFRDHFGWILMDIMGEFLWTFMFGELVNFWGQLGWILVDTT